jgi:polyribonucleotide nucleotidyltransferase
MNQSIPVKLLEVDRMGRLNLSYVDALEDTTEQKK